MIRADRSGRLIGRAYPYVATSRAANNERDPADQDSRTSFPDKARPNFPERFRRQIFLDLFRFHPAEAATMMDKRNARGAPRQLVPIRRLDRKLRLQPPVPFSSIIHAAPSAADG